jgi:hypothetical protein
VQIVTDYHEDYRDNLKYIYDTWLTPWTDRLCKYSTNELRHYGITTTSRAEGIHRVLKSSLKISTGDLMTVVDRIEVMLINQLKTYRMNLTKAKRSTPYALSHTVFRNLLGRVTPHALWMMYGQFQRLNKATTKDPLPPCTGVFTKTMGLPCSHAIKARMEEVEDDLGRLLINDVDVHWHFKKPPGPPTANFTSDRPAINEATAEPLGSMEDIDPDQPLPDIDEIIRGLQTNNLVQRPTPEAPEPAAELIDDDIDLLDVNEPRIAKAKGRPVGARNRKGIMTRAEKAKAKSTRRDPSGFEHVDAAIKASRGGKRTVAESARGGRNQARSRKQKEVKIDDVAAMDADIQAFNKDMDEIHDDIRGIITRQTARKAAKEAVTISAASATSTIITATTKEAILVDDDSEFDADGDGDADSDDDWMYDYS